MNNARNIIYMTIPVLALLVVGATVKQPLSLSWRYWLFRESTVSIGFYTDFDAQERDAIKALSVDMKQHPRANVYLVRASSPSVTERTLLLYTRNPDRPSWSTIQIDDKNRSLAAGSDMATEAEIHTIADRSGNLNDLVSLTSANRKQPGDNRPR